MGYQVNDNIVILGDLNSDLFIANNNKLIETMMLLNLANIISKPTRINWQRRVIESTISSFSINVCLSTLSYSQTSRLNETETLFGNCKKVTEAS
jgi:hypothetical protein